MNDQLEQLQAEIAALRAENAELKQRLGSVAAGPQAGLPEDFQQFKNKQAQQRAMMADPDYGAYESRLAGDARVRSIQQQREMEKFFPKNPSAADGLRAKARPMSPGRARPIAPPG